QNQFQAHGFSPSDLRVPKQPVVFTTSPHGRPEWTYRFKGGAHMPKAGPPRNNPAVSLGGGKYAGAILRPCGERNLIVVPGRRGAHQGRLAGPPQIAQRPRPWNACGVTVDAHVGNVCEMTEVGEQAVRNIDRGAGNSEKRSPERDARLRQAIARDERRHALFRLECGEPTSRVANGAGDETQVAGFGARPQDGFFLWYRTKRGDRNAEWPARRR